MNSHSQIAISLLWMNDLLYAPLSSVYVLKNISWIETSIPLISQ